MRTLQAFVRARYSLMPRTIDSTIVSPQTVRIRDGHHHRSERCNRPGATVTGDQSGNKVA